MDILAGVSEFFTEKGCYVHHFLTHQPPHIKVKSHMVKGYVECQIKDGRLCMTYKFAVQSDLATCRFMANGGRYMVELNNPQSLNLAFRYIRKHLFPHQPELRGGIGDKVYHKRK